MKKGLIFLLSAFLGSGLQAQQETEELLDWSADRPLRWDDYKAKPDPASDAAATTASYLVFSYNIRNNEFTYIIESKFSKTKSWGLHKTDYILSHEQGHFNISEIFARKLKKKIIEYQFNSRTYQKDLAKIYKAITDEKEKMQRDYDQETNHSINKTKQAEWLKKINSLLDDYAAYAGYQKRP